MNEIITDGKFINNKIFLNYSKFFVKDLISARQDKNEKLVNNVNDRLIDLRNVINGKETPKNENPKKGVNIFKKSSIYYITKR